MAEYRGYTTTVEVGQHVLTLRHKRAPHRGPANDVTIPFANVIQIHAVAPTMLLNGWIQLDVDQPREPLRATDVAADANSVLFTFRQRRQFEALHDLLAARLNGAN